MRWIVVLLAILVTSPARTESKESPTSEAYPQRPIKVIVPFGAGGGSDTFVRILQKTIEENRLLPQPLVIINVPGAGGTIGSRQAMESDPDGYTFMCLHEGIITSKYAGITDYGPEAFEAIAATGEVGSVIAVASDAKYEDLNQLLDTAAARPQEVVFSANVGAPSHFAGLMLESANPGTRFRYTQTGGGAKRFAALAGGHIDVSTFSLAEYMQFQSAGLRGLAICGEARHPDAPDLPTATEQGVDVINSIMHFWWAPKNTPQDQIRAFAEVLEKAMQAEQVQRRLASIHTDTVFLTGDALQKSLAERERGYASVTQHALTKLPNFPAIVLAVVVLLGLVVAWEHLPRKQSDSSKLDQPGTEAPSAVELVSYVRRPGLAILVVVLTAVYIAVMQAEWIGFRIATAAYVLTVGTMLAPANARRYPALGGLAIVMSVGLHYVFTNVFTISLP